MYTVRSLAIDNSLYYLWSGQLDPFPLSLSIAEVYMRGEYKPQHVERERRGMGLAGQTSIQCHNNNMLRTDK